MARYNKRDPSGWEPLAEWYDGWMGADGSDHHRKLAIPTVLDLLDLQPDEAVLDIGAGQGVLAPHVTATGARYTGIDVSARLLALARERHRHATRFIQADARRLSTVRALQPASFDAAVFLLSIQDMNPLEDVVRSAAWALRDGGRLVILMTHPCFRVPRQSGWGYDAARKLHYRRVDRYLSPLAVPMKAYGGGRGTSISFHRPLGQYVAALAANGLLLDALREVVTFKPGATKAARLANAEVPLFVGLRAVKLEGKR